MLDMVGSGRNYVPTETLEAIPPLAWLVLGLNMEHSLGLAVGDHTDDAHDQQGHTDTSNCQHSLLVQLLSLCRAEQEQSPWRRLYTTSLFPSLGLPQHRICLPPSIPSPCLLADCLCLPSDFHYHLP